MTTLRLSPVGTVPAGFGSPEQASPIAGVALTDATGQQQAGRYINIHTGRYEIDENGRYVGSSVVAQRVQLALTTQLGTSSQYTVGIVPTGGVIGQNFASRRRADIVKALSPLVDDKSIEIVDIFVDASRRPIYTQIVWRDLTTKLEQRTQI